MAISLVGTAANSSTGGTAITITLPGGVQQNDVVYVIAGSQRTANFTPSMSTAGYTTVASEPGVGGTSEATGVFRKVMGSTPDTTAVVNGSTGSNSNVAICYVLRGV